MEIEALEAILMDDFKGLYSLVILVFPPCYVYASSPKPCNIIDSSEFLVPEIHSSESGLNTSNRCFEITICPQVNIPSHLLEHMIDHTLTF